MRRTTRYILWLTTATMLLATAVGAAEFEAFSFQKDRDFRNISGLVTAGVILFQWCLTLGRAVFQRAGSRWDRWVRWHLRSAIALPLLLLLHSIALGWGLLALLPLALLMAGHFGTMLDDKERLKTYLPYHIALSALTLVLAIVHAITVLTFN
nr:hypothetical protein [Flavobacteriales bacterium]